MTFKKEIRYIVAKVKEVEAALDYEELRELSNLLEKVKAYRVTQGKTPIECVVVESDWPMYDTTWDTIEKWCSEHNL